MKKIIFTLFIIHCTLLIANAQWQPDVRLTNDPAGSYTSENNAWCVAASGTVVHVSWLDYRNGTAGIYYKRSSDAGVSWGADIRLTNDTAPPQDPSISVSGLLVHVVWNYYNLNDEIYYKRSTDAGVTWGADTRLTNNPAYSGYPSVAVSGSVVHVVWQDARDGNYEIYYKRSTDAGASWGTDTRLTNNTAYSRFPSVAVSGSIVHVVWYDFRDGNYEIYYKHSTDAGLTWGTDTRLTNNSADSWYPYVTVSGTVVHVVWSDTRDGIYSNEIFYKRSTDAGVSWEADTRLTNDPANSMYPFVAVSGSVVNVVWQDGRDNSWEIYYKRDPTGNTIGIKNITSEIPSSYSLQQNYPNPFNPTTKIKFDIPNRSPIGTFGDDNVVSKVFDLLGKEIATLVNEQLAPGSYDVTFDASMLPSGIYFYRLETTDFVQTNKMLLIR